MNQPLSGNSNEKPLRFAEPELYRMLINRLDAYHLHPFDIHAGVMYEGECMLITFVYGEDLIRKNRSFAPQDSHSLNAELEGFFREIAEDCKRTLIADYYKIMKVYRRN